MHYFFKNPHLETRTTWIKQAKYMMTLIKEESTQILNFMTPGAGVLVLGRGHILFHIEKKLKFFKNLLLKC